MALDIRPVDDPPAAGGTTSVQVPVDVRNVALVVLALLAVVFTIHWAKAILIPIVLSIFLSYTLRPAVIWMKKRARVPEPLGAGVVLILAVMLIGSSVWALQPQATKLMDSVPRAAKSLERVLQRSALDQTGPVQKLMAAAQGLERAAVSPSAAATSKKRQAELAGATPSNLRAYLWRGAEALISGLADTVVVLALTYFLLISGQSFKRKLVRITGTTLSQKKITVQILDEIDSQMQRYLVIQVVTSALVGVGTGLAFAVIGLENALFWGVAAGVLHLIPYIGPTIVVVASAVFAWAQFNAFNEVLLVVASSVVVAGLIGFGMVPWLTEKVGRINAVTTFVTLIAWEWLWGIPGLLLGIPIMMAVMAVCERIDNLNPIAEMLSGHAARETG